MIKELVKTKLKLLYLSGCSKEIDEIIREAEEKNSSYYDFLNSLLEVELEARNIRKRERLIKGANFPLLKNIVDFDFSIRPNLDKHKILSLCDGSFLENRENIIFIGNPGVGKTHLSISIGNELCRKSKQFLFTTATGLINKLREAKDEKALSRFIKSSNKYDLIIIDEIGYFPYEKDSSELFFQYISEKYEKKSLMITTNLPFSKWNEIFYTERLTTAILDRIIHHCEIVEISGESFRFSQSVKKNDKK